MEKRIRDAITTFREWLVHFSAGCQIQSGWPCGTCIIALLTDMGVVEDGQHNKPVDKVNEVWRAILQIRENDATYKKYQKESCSAKGGKDGRRK